ncbi:MAG: glycosyltransferase [Chitinophagaceae bacterium]
MNIIYVGEDKPSSTSFHRAEALKRLGHQVTVLNPYQAAGKQLRHPLMGKIHFRTGYRFVQDHLFKWLKAELAAVDGKRTDTVFWVNSGELIGPRLLKLMKEYKFPAILYNTDDPTGTRDGNRFRSLLKAIKYYDLCAVIRDMNVSEYKNLGAAKVYRTTTCYDEVYHKGFEPESSVPPEYRSDVAFIGTWMRHEHRDKFLLKLINAGIPVSIWGDRWQKSPHWNELKKYYRGGALSGRNYVAAMQGAKIALGMLSHGNRDKYTRRSVETPYAGGLLCAERTSEHTRMYKENEEAVFWKDADECIAVCKTLLNDDHKREQIRRAGMKKVRELGMGNETICSGILNQL